MSTTTAPTATSVRQAIAMGEDRQSAGPGARAGYLAMDEYETRLQATFAAHTMPTAQLVTDLPLTQSAAAIRSARPRDGGRLGWPADSSRRVPHDGRHRAHVWVAVGLTAGAWYFGRSGRSSVRVSASPPTPSPFASRCLATSRASSDRRPPPLRWRQVPFARPRT